MEKISHIVRGNPRIASVDMKGGAAVRPGAPSYGRPVGESPQAHESGETTAQRATAIQNQMNEQKKLAEQNHTVAKMADQFFMTRIRRPDEDVEVKAMPKQHVAASRASDEVEAEASTEAENEGGLEVEPQAPSGYTPRGSYVNVHA